MSTSPLPYPDRLRAAESHLSSASPRLAELITTVGPCALAPNPDVFRMLVGSLISQFISTAAARAIQARLVARLKGRVNPTRLLALPAADLAACGISGAKAKAVRGVAEHFKATRGLAAQLAAADDAGVRGLLLPLHGVGPWTVDMLLMFSLSRLDIWPVGDLGVRAGVRDWFGLTDLPAGKPLEEMAEPWRPYRSVAAWYMWRVRDAKPRQNGNG